MQLKPASADLAVVQDSDLKEKSACCRGNLADLILRCCAVRYCSASNRYLTAKLYHSVWEDTKKLQSQEANCDALFRKAAQLLKAQRIPHRYGVRAGKRSDAITAATDRHQIDLVVMGTRGIGSLARLFLGSVAMAVAQGSRVPVTFVK